MSKTLFITFNTPIFTMELLLINAAGIFFYQKFRASFPTFIFIKKFNKNEH